MPGRNVVKILMKNAVREVRKMLLLKVLIGQPPLLRKMTMAVAVYGDIEVPGQKDDIGLAYKSKGDVRVTNSFN